MKATLRTWTPNIRRAAARALRWVQRSLIRVLIVLAVATTAVGMILSVVLWDWLHAASQSPSETIRNLGLVHGGGLALVIALWRGWVADREADTARQGLLNQRYREGAEMLGSAVLSVRIAGIHALQRLVDDHPDEYHTRTMRVLCAFVRRPTVDEGGETRSDRGSEQSSAIPLLRDDVQAAMEAISACHERHWQIEIEAESGLDLRGADLRRARLQGANLAIGKKVTPWQPWLPYSNKFTLQTGVDLSNADLRFADLTFAKLQFANLESANLSGARLWFAELYGARLHDANFADTDLSGTHFSNAEAQGGFRSPGPSQEQLDAASAQPDMPPSLDDLTDPLTGEQLVWRGKPLEDAA